MEYGNHQKAKISIICKPKKGTFPAGAVVNMEVATA